MVLTATAKIVVAAVVLTVGIVVGALLVGRGPDRMAGPATSPTVTPSPAVPVTPPPRPTADPAGAGGRL